MIFHDKHTLHHNISIVIVVIVVMIIVILIDRSSQTFLLSLCDVVIRLVDGFLYRATLKKTQQKKVIRKYASLTQAGAFQISTAGSIHFHIGGRRQTSIHANYSSRNDNGKYFGEIEVLVCLEMI